MWNEFTAWPYGAQVPGRTPPQIPMEIGPDFFMNDNQQQLVAVAHPLPQPSVIFANHSALTDARLERWPATAAQTGVP